jgi:Effector-associated domain 1
LEFAGTDRVAFERILMFTDRPPDLNTEEFPTISAGYLASEAYVVQVTQSDSGARRAGMVRTTAVLISLEVLDRISLRATLRLLASGDPVRAFELSDVAVDTDEQRSDVPGAGAVVDALIDSGSVIWTGGGFEDAITRVWEELAFEDRRRFTFSTAVHPGAVSVPCPPASLVVLRTADRYAQRWTWPRVEAETPGPTSPGGRAMLAGTHPVRDFAKAFLPDPVRLEQWRHLAEIQRRVESLSDLDHEGLRALAQLVCLLAPEPSLGREIKAAVAKRLGETTALVSFGDLMGLRTVAWSTLSGGESVDSLTGAWAASVWVDADRTDDFTAAITAIDAACDEFLAGVAACLRSAALAKREHLPLKAAAVARRHDGATALRWLVDVFGPREVDRALKHVRTADTAAWLSAVSHDLGLPVAHATSVETRDSTAAWRAQLDLPTAAEAMDRLASRVGSVGTVEASLALTDDLLTARAASLVAVEPHLLPADASRDRAARALWAAAVRAGADPWTTVSPADARTELLRDVIDGETIDPVLLRALADTDAADVFDLPGRAELWRRLPGDVQESLLSATASAAADSVASGGPIPEVELRRVLLSPGILGQLARRDPRAAITLVDRLSGTAAEALIVMRAARFDPPSSVAFGDLVLNRRWKAVARALADVEPSRPDLRHAADRAQALLGLRDRIKRAVGLGEPVKAVATAEELQSALLETTVELYPQGPTQRSVWERADGDESDLPERDTGRERWRGALAVALSGARGAPSPKRLLAVMLEDYPHNSELRALSRAVGDDSHG